MNMGEAYRNPDRESRRACMKTYPVVAPRAPIGRGSCASIAVPASGDAILANLGGNFSTSPIS
jgi:hypothetical protein